MLRKKQMTNRTYLQFLYFPSQRRMNSHMLKERWPITDAQIGLLPFTVSLKTKPFHVKQQQKEATTFSCISVSLYIYNFLLQTIFHHRWTNHLYFVMLVVLNWLILFSHYQLSKVIVPLLVLLAAVSQCSHLRGGQGCLHSTCRWDKELKQVETSERGALKKCHSA